jgi:hypothetical protein
MTSQKNVSAKGKCIYSNLRWPPKIKHIIKKNITINYTHLIHKARQILSTLLITVTVTVSVFVFLTLTPNIPILFPVIPQHTIISLIRCIGYTSLFKTPDNHLWWDALPCYYGLHWLIHLHFLVYTLTWTHDNSQFSPQMVLRIYIHVFWISLSCLWSSQSEFMALFVVFNLLIGPGFIFQPH